MAETKMQLVDWLDDLCVRFIINLPQEELQSVERICFQVEEAQWFYEDFIRPLDASLPSLTLRQFCLLIFQHCPLLAPFPVEQHIAAFDEFLAYKVRVPVRGAIMLNEAMDQVVLVKGWKKGANWSFPRGKINKAEDDLDCAIREVYEETGFHIAMAGIVPAESEQKYFEVTMREQHMKMFVFKGVPQDTVFAARTRKEISDIKWYDLASLPGWRKTKNKQGGSQQETLKANKFYMVAPFLQPLKRWINEQKKRSLTAPETSLEQYATDDGLAHAPVTIQNVMLAPQHVEHRPHETLQSPAVDLLALLRGQTPAAPVPVHAPHAAISHIDAADRLKHMLSVGTNPVAAAPTPQHRDANATDLLAMLRQGSTAMLEPPVQPPGPPRTPVDQIANVAYEPRRPPHHHRVSSNAAPIGPPPDFAYSPARIAQQQAQYPRTSYSQPQQPVFAPAQPTHIAWNAPQQTQQAARPFERTGDPQFAREEMPVPQVSGVPSANQLPAPSLSSHAMNLLNAFKSSTKPNVLSPPSQNTATAQSNTAPAPIPNLSFALTNARGDVQAAQGDPTAADSRARQGLSQGPAADDGSSGQLLNPASGSVVGKPSASRSTNAQKNSLLNLFRTPSAMAPEAVVTSTIEPEPRSTSYAQAAQPVSHKETQRRPILPQEALIPESSAAHTHTRSSQGQSSQASDVTTSRRAHHSPTKTEEGTVRRKPRAKVDMTDSPGLSDSSIGAAGTTKKTRGTRASRDSSTRAAAQHPMPIQILKRPVPANTVEAPTETASKRPENPAAQTVSVEQAAATSPKPFQPQILRRPQGATPTTSFELPAVTTPEAVSKRDTASVSEKTKALLSLFEQSRSPRQAVTPMSPTNNTSPVIGALASPNGSSSLMALLRQSTPATVSQHFQETTTLPEPVEIPEAEQTKALSPETDSKSALLSLFGTNKGKQPQSQEKSSLTGTTPSAEQRSYAEAQAPLLSLFKKPAVPASANANTSKPQSPTHMPQNTLDRGSSSQADHQASLLSLLQQWPPSSVLSNRNSIGSMAPPPRQPTPADVVAAGLKRTSIASPTNEPGSDGTGRSRINSMTSRDGVRSGSQTPMSTTDRGFLLSYLKGLS